MFKVVDRVFIWTLVQGSKYLVSGFVQHVNGHFIAFVRCGGRWWKCDDSIVTGPADVSTIWPTMIFWEKYRRRSLLAPPALTPAGNIARLRCLPLHLSRVVLEAARATKSGHADPCRIRSAGSHRAEDHMACVGRFALGERVRRQERQRCRKRKLSADGALLSGMAKRRKRDDERKPTGRTQQRTGRTHQRTGRTEQRSGRTQQHTGRTQQRTGRTQQRTGRTQQRTGRTQHTGRTQQRLDTRTRQRTAFGCTGAANIDGRREDPWAEEDHPFNRFKANYGLCRAAVEEELREWPEMAISMLLQPCLLCEAGFSNRPALLQHIDQKHGGLQRYRHAMLMLESLSPHVVVGSEVRQFVRNYASFLRESRMDWEGAEEATLRRRLGCCFCARSFWKEELFEVFIAGEHSFMMNPDVVWKFLSVERYKERWPLIPEAELLASSVSVVDSFGQKVSVLLHKRRVDADMICGNSAASVCRDCYYAFAPKQPKLCKFALANDLWLGRPDPLLWQANMTHEMCLALARTVATKVVLRAGGAQQN